MGFYLNKNIRTVRMGKTSRTTRAKKKDFNKVKLKAGKKRPAPNNETRTNFKAQSVFVSNIVGTSQSDTKDDATAVGGKKIDPSCLVECISKISNNSATQRYHALMRIKDVVKNVEVTSK